MNKKVDNLKPTRFDMSLDQQIKSKIRKSSFDWTLACTAVISGQSNDLALATCSELDQLYRLSSLKQYYLMLSFIDIIVVAQFSKVFILML